MVMVGKIMDIISVIVPVYNVENYIDECVNSLINQTYVDIEIILVDDGSTDNSGILCDNFAKIDSRIKSLHKSNGGLSDARNYGINHSSGKYIMFVDSDDVVDKNIVYELHEHLKYNLDSDLVVSQLTHFYDGKDPNYFHSLNTKLMTNEEAIEDFLYQKVIQTSACGKLYKKDILTDIRFVKDQRFEDNEFVFKILLNSNNIIFSESKLYAYRHRENSITTTKFDEKEFDIIMIGKKILEYSESLNEQIRLAAKTYQCTNCLRLYLTATDDYINDYRFVYCKNYIKDCFSEIFLRSKARKKMKICLFLWKINTPRKLLVLIRRKNSRWK